MSEYLYILSNPEIPGLVKIGKTTVPPIKPIAELKSAGKPVPLVLEFSAEVTSGEQSERAAHRALDEFRVSSRLKFFRTTVPKALETILPVIGDYKALDVNKANDLPSLERMLKKRRLAAEQKEAERLAAHTAKVKAEKEARQQEKYALEVAIADERRALKRLGPRPLKQTMPILWFGLIFCYSPSPIGWIFWLGALAVFLPATMMVGVACICLVILGFLANKVDLAIDETYENAIAPFLPVYDRIQNLEQQLRDLIASPWPH